MYHRPRPEGPGLALYPPGCQRVNTQMTHRRQPAEGRRESTDQVTALTASDQYTEGILRSVQAVCIVTYVVKCASNLHSYLCKWYALLVTYQVCKMGAQLPMLSSYQVCKLLALLVSYQVCKLLAQLVAHRVRKLCAQLSKLLSYQGRNLITLLPMLSSTQDGCIVTYVCGCLRHHIKYAI